MAQPRASAPPIPATVGIIAPDALAATALAALALRGIAAERATVGGALADHGILAWALEQAPAPATAVEIAVACARAAREGRPICVLAPQPKGTSRVAIERTAGLALVRAHGAALAHDVDAWLESIVMLVRYGLPMGPRAAVVAPAGSWLEAQATAIATEIELSGTRANLVAVDEPSDVALYDPTFAPPPPLADVLAVPVLARAELASSVTAPAQLFGARAALGAVAILGRAAQRMAVGLGPAPAAAAAELAIDHERLRRQLAKLATEPRLGDHETKVLLAAYGVAITRQAVATTPSAAVKLARRAGFPVQIKPWGHDLPTETAGCPLETNITSDALVRAAFTSVLVASGKSNLEGAAVIVRETPPVGRELAVSLLRLPAIGWTVVLEAPGATQIAAAPAPLRLVDAQTLAAQVLASRAGEGEVDRAGLANLLRRASHLVADLDDRLVGLELSKIVVGSRGSRTLVVDAHVELR